MTASNWPFEDAKANGVKPFAELRLASAPSCGLIASLAIHTMHMRTGAQQQSQRLCVAEPYFRSPCPYVPPPL